MYAGSNFLTAASQGDISAVEKLLKKGLKDVNCKEGQNAQTALHAAAHEGKFEMAYYLLSQGADPSATDSQGWSPAHCAAVNGHLKICSLLFTRGSDPNAVNHQKTSVLHYVIRCQYSEELIEVLNLMIENGANLECRNSFEETPLIQASMKGLTESVRFLIDHYANVNSQRVTGQTALHTAVEVGSVDCALLLLKNGADKTIQSDTGTPLEIAIKRGYTDLIAILEGNDYSGSTYTAFQGDTQHLPFTRVKSKYLTQSDLTDDDSEDIDQFEIPTVTPSTSLKEMPFKVEEYIISQHPGFYIENSHPEAKDDRNLLFQPCNYKNWFYHSEDHHNFVGRMNRARVTHLFEPLIVSILQESRHNRLRIIVWTRMGDKQFFFPLESGRKDIKWSKGIPQDIQLAIKEKILEIRVKEKDVQFTLEHIKSFQGFKDRLLDFEVDDPLRPKCFSVGVLYAKEGQTTESENFNNEKGSQLFEEFIDFLGDRVPLRGWTGYRGDLDTKTDGSGPITVYRRWKGFEIMFHVSTLLPYDPGQEQQIQRKRRIGNDIGVIVFQEGGKYTPPIRSQFLHVYYVVSPCGKNMYKMGVTAIDGGMKFGPPLPDPPVFNKGHDFRDFLLTKVINGLLASLRHPALREKIWCLPKEAFLYDLVKDYCKNKTIVSSLKQPSPHSWG